MSAIDQAAIERLYEDETLTKDLEDAPARVLLQWGEKQLKQGRLEATVRQEMKTIALVIRDRAALPPAEAAMRLCAAGLQAAESPLAEFWGQGGLAAADWVARLLDRVQPASLPSTVAADLGQPLASSPLPAASGPTEPEGGERSAIPWWQRLLFWRRRG